jgi:hypothetical protein
MTAAAAVVVVVVVTRVLSDGIPAIYPRQSLATPTIK